MDRERTSWGSVQTEGRANGVDVWVWRWRETTTHKSRVIGKKADLSFAQACIKARRLWKDRVFDNKVQPTLAVVLQQYREHGMGYRRSALGSCLSRLKRIEDEFGKLRLEDVFQNFSGIERWLRELQTLPRITKAGHVTRSSEPVSHKTKLHFRAQLFNLADFAMKKGLLALNRNPMELITVRSAIRKRKRQATVLTVQQYRALIALPDLGEHVRTMVQLAMCLGLRASEILALQWSDIDLLNGNLKVERSVVGKHLGETKSEASQAQLPLDPLLVQVLMRWRTSGPVIKDWVFGSPVTERPFHRDALHKDHLLPAARKIGLIRLGWHDFRHTHRALLRDLGLPIEVQQKLMRHSSIAMTVHYGNSSPMYAIEREANRLLVEHVATKSTCTSRVI